MNGSSSEVLAHGLNLPPQLMGKLEAFSKHFISIKLTQNWHKSPWDMQKFLYMQCEHSQVPFPDWAKDWIDVRKLFANWFGISRCNIFKMLNYIKLEFEGQQHCGKQSAPTTI